MTPTADQKNPPPNIETLRRERSRWYRDRLSINSSSEVSMLAEFLDSMGSEVGWLSFQLHRGSPLRMDPDYAAAVEKKGMESK